MHSFELGIVLLDNSTPIASNEEGVRILTHSAEGLTDADGLLRQSVRNTVPPTSDFPVTIGEIKSGKRRYSWQSVLLDQASHRPETSRSVLLLSRPGHMPARADLIADQFGLTQRERECVQYLLVGLTNKDIAKRMRISVSTVNTFLHLVMVKVGASSRCSILLKFLCAMSD